MSAPARVGVLVSGSGTNLQALIDACEAPGFPARIACVVSNVEGAFACARAESAGIPHTVISHRGLSREDFERALVAHLRAAGVEWVCLAGFMRLLGSTLLEAFPGKVINIHPGLLPAFPGLHAPRQALEHGAKIAGCTVHLVDAGTDTGPILAQAAVPVLPDDDEEKLAARILEQEHVLYPMCLRLLVEGAFQTRGRRRAATRGNPPSGGSLRNPEPDLV